jgi:hypothetical protein
MNLPRRIYFTGAPGSKWSGIAQQIEEMDGFNTTDRRLDRTYAHSGFSGHVGAYFGEEMEFSADPTIVHEAYEDPEAGCMLLKSHDWAYDLPELYARAQRVGDWIMMVYRPSQACLTWWFKAGGFDITYPDYSWYKDEATMAYEIERQNSAMLKFGREVGVVWEYPSNDTLHDMFGAEPRVPIAHDDVLIALIQ